MAVLTEAIEAERGAGVVIANAVGLVVTVTVTNTVLVATSTAVVDGLALALGRLTMIAITAPRAAPVAMSEMKIDALAVTANEARAREAARGPRSLLRMSVTGVPFSFSSLLRG